jgi:hypothetical protein
VLAVIDHLMYKPSLVTPAAALSSLISNIIYTVPNGFALCFAGCGLQQYVAENAVVIATERSGLQVSKDHRPGDAIGLDQLR